MKPSRWGIALSLCGCLVFVGCQPGGPSTGGGSTTEKGPAASGEETSSTPNETAENVVVIEPGPDAQKAAQEALIYAEEGDVIEFAEGEFEFAKTLSLDETIPFSRIEPLDRSRYAFTHCLAPFIADPQVPR